MLKMDNTLTAATLKRRGMAAIEERLIQGPVRILKHNKAVAVVLSEAEYRRLTSDQAPTVPGLTALQWLLTQTKSGERSKQEIDNDLASDRAW